MPGPLPSWRPLTGESQLIGEAQMTSNEPYGIIGSRELQIFREVEAAKLQRGRGGDALPWHPRGWGRD